MIRRTGANRLWRLAAALVLTVCLTLPALAAEPDPVPVVLPDPEPAASEPAAAEPASAEPAPAEPAPTGQPTPTVPPTYIDPLFGEMPVAPAEGEPPPVLPPPPEEPHEAFEMGRLFAGRSIKPAVATELIGFGLHFQIAPVRAVAKQAIENFKQDNPEVTPLIELTEQVDLAAVKAASDDERRQLFLDIPGLTAEDRQAVEDFDFAATHDAVNALIDIASDPEDAITFSLEPFFTFNTDLVSFTLIVPMAGFSLSGDTTVEFGNITLDTKFGHMFGDFPTVGLSYGLALNFPSGTERADALALTNQLDAPRYLHRYLGMTPYVTLGLDLEFVLLQATQSLTILAGVRDDPRPDSSVYYGYSVGLIVTPGAIISVDAELSGLVDLYQAQAFGVHAFTGGLRFHFAGIRPGLAVQIPIAVPSRDALGQNSGLAYGSVADINALVQIDAGF